MADTERSIEQECDSLEAEALKGGEFVGITNDLALRLVAALRSERTQQQKLRDSVAETVADVLSDWHYAHDDSDAERHIAHGSFTLAHALTHCICFGAGMRVAETFAAELERERTQNLRLSTALDECERLFIGWSWAGVSHDIERLRNLVRAALSTQEGEA